MPLCVKNWSVVPTRSSRFRRVLVMVAATMVPFACSSATPPVVLREGSVPRPTGTPIASPDIRGPVEPNAHVTYVTDGDTITVRFTKPPRSTRSEGVEPSETETVLAKGDTRVRLIGIDTPESKRPNTPIECFAKESGSALAGLIPVGTAVRIELDVEHRDTYGRLLGYVFRSADGLFVNHEMVRAGMAAALTYPPNVAYADQLVGAATGARESRVGLWSRCASEHEPTETP